MRGILFGGPVDRRVIDDVPEETDAINIPASGGLPKYARYVRTGDGINRNGPYLRFDFRGVHTVGDKPITAV
jgi:hypothetical protein